MKCRECQKNETDNTTGICYECQNDGSVEIIYPYDEKEIPTSVKNL